MKIKAIIACCFLIWLVSFKHTAKVENIEGLPEFTLPNAKAHQLPACYFCLDLATGIYYILNAR